MPLPAVLRARGAGQDLQTGGRRRRRQPDGGRRRAGRTARAERCRQDDHLDDAARRGDPDAGWVEIAGYRLPRYRSEAADAGRVRRRVPAAARAPPASRVPGHVRQPVRPGRARQLRWRRDWSASASPHLADNMGNELSSGQRTLVGIIKATLHRPRLLVLDEPTASLDPDVALRVRTGLEAGCAPRRARPCSSPATTWSRSSGCASGSCSSPAADRGRRQRPAVVAARLRPRRPGRGVPPPGRRVGRAGRPPGGERSGQGSGPRSEAP